MNNNTDILDAIDEAINITHEPVHAAADNVEYLEPSYLAVNYQDPCEPVLPSQSGVESMFYVNKHVSTGDAVETWHKRGTPIPEALQASDVETVLDYAGLNWDVHVSTPGDEIGLVEDYKILRRSDTNAALAIMRKTYETFQNREALEFGNVLLAGGAKVNTAGSLWGGKRVWMLLEVPREDTLNLPGIDHPLYAPFVCISCSHDGKGAVRADATTIWCQCANSLRMGIDKAVSSVKYRHTRNMRSRMESARDVLGFSSVYFDAFDAEVRELSSRMLTSAQLSELLEGVFPVSDKMSDRQKSNALSQRATVKRLHDDDDRVDLKGTFWGAINAVNTFDLKVRGVHGGEAGRMDREIEGIFSGDTMKLTDRARKLVRNV